MTKVLLISANTLRMPYPVYPLGLDYVAGSLDSRYQTKIVDLNTVLHLDDLGVLIREFSPDFVGISIRNVDNLDTINSRAFLADYHNIVSQIRKNSQARLILGGSGYTVFPVEFLQALGADSPVDYYKMLADAGLTHVEFGTESLSDTMLTNLQKPFVARDVFVAHKQALKANLHIAHYFLLGGPGENAQTLQDTLNGVDTLEKSLFFFFCGIRIYPHTDLYDVALKEGQISLSQSLLQPVFYSSRHISGKEIMQAVENHANSRFNWIVGSGENKVTRILPKLYEMGYTGPLWEYLI